jgi:hypothetical protein
VGTEELAERLTAIADELADLAIAHLRRASEELGASAAPDPALLSEERRITRARRAVEKAAALLRGGPGR